MSVLPLTSTHSSIPTACETAIEKSKPILFEKYVVRNEEDLNKLQSSGKLKGAIVITGDKKHVGIHKIFFIIQKICEIIEPLLEKIRGYPIKIDANLCHGMIVVGWDNSYNKEKEIQNNRPLLSHSVQKGVKVNAVNYFTYPDQDVDHMVVFIPKEKTLRDELAKNSEQMAKTKQKTKKNGEVYRSPLCKFSWSKLIGSMFKTQIHKEPSKKMKKELAYALADTLLNENPICSNSGPKGKKPRHMFCMEFATLMLQVSIITSQLTEDEKQKLRDIGDRKEIAKEIISKMDKLYESDSLSKAYWSNRSCRTVDASCIMSAYAAHIFSNYSEECCV